MVKVGIIGAGRIGKLHITSICTRVRNGVIKTVADPFMNEETAAWAESMGVQHTTTDYKEILNDPEIDAVLICSSTDTHSSISVEAINAGKHVFCEKPIDHDLAKIKEVVKALEGKDLKYMVGFNRRFDTHHAAVRQAIVDGKIGNMELVKISSRDPEPPSIEYVKGSGGIFMDMMIHDFDMVRFLTGADVEEVYTISNVLVDPAIGEAGDVDTAIVSLKMSNGALAVIDNSRRSVYGYDQRLEVFGSKGMVQDQNVGANNTIISNENGVTTEKPVNFFLERYLDAYAKEITSFIDCIENNTPAPMDVWDGLKPVMIAQAATISSKEGRPVKMSEIKF